jgi:thiol-disulfide isomerase/thioredoxin
MKFSIQLAAVLMAAVVTGVSLAPALRPAYAAPKKAPCAVCSVREGSGAEAVKATSTYEGKEYYFCTEKCRAEFLKDPQAFLKANTPRPAPAFSLKDLSGSTVSLADYKGKVVLLDFWATFCGPCMKAMPRLQKLHEELGPKGFSVLGVATDEEGAKLVAPAVAKLKVKYPILLTEPSTWKNYQVETLPALFLIDRSGQIVERFGGNTDHKKIAAAVRKLVGE